MWRRVLQCGRCTSVTAAFPPRWRPPSCAGVQFQCWDECRQRCLPEEGRRRERAPASWAGAWHRGGGDSAVCGSPTGLARSASSLCGRGTPGSRSTAAAEGNLLCGAWGGCGWPPARGMHGQRPASLSCSLCLPGRVGSVGCVRSRPSGASSPPPVASFPESLRQTLARGDATWAISGRVSGSWREKGEVGLPSLCRPQVAPQSW